jgi:uncharacterized membrane protein YbhN (UPF0104 family)
LAAGAAAQTSAQHRRQLLGEARGNLRGRLLKLAGYLLVAYAVLRLIPALKQALHSLERVSWEWLLAALALEVLSETGFVIAWSAIIDPDNTLGSKEGDQRIDQHVAWAQLGGGLLLPGGSLGGMGVGGMILHRFGMPTKVIAERQVNLSLLNTAVDAVALVVFGVGLATGIFNGERNLLLTLLPAAVAAVGVTAAVLLAGRITSRGSELTSKHKKLGTTLVTLAAAVEDTKQLLMHRSAWRSVLGIIAYLGFDVVMLWIVFLAVHTHPFPGLPIVVMAYVIGALGGSIPLPAAAGVVGGMAGTLILYGVKGNPALAAVLVHQAVGLLVPVAGGAIAYLILRHRLGSLREAPSDHTDARAEHSVGPEQPPQE